MSTSLIAHSSSPSQPDFSGLWIPLVTPFRGGDVDHPALKRLASHYAGCGVAGLVVCGSTGEAAALDDDEQMAVLQTVLSATPGLPLIMGVSGSHLGQTQARIQALNSLALAGILLPAPSYVRPSQAGLLDWFTVLADASQLPVVLYDIPYRTGSTLTTETLLTLAGHQQIRAVKDCGGDPAKTRAVIADGRLQVLAGEDINIRRTMTQGGSGAIAAAAHFHTQRWVQVIDKARAGDVAGAEALWAPLPALIEAVFAEPNPGPLKALLARQGWLANELRSPMTRASAELEERLEHLHSLAA